MRKETIPNDLEGKGERVDKGRKEDVRRTDLGIGQLFLDDKLIKLVRRPLGNNVRVHLPVRKHDRVRVDVAHAGQVLSGSG